MKLSKAWTSLFSVTLLAYFIYAPMLLFVPFASLIPKLIIAGLSLLLFLAAKRSIIISSPAVILLLLNSLSLFCSFVTGNSALIFPLFLYSLMFLIILSVKGFPERIVESAFEIQEAAQTSNYLSIFFLLLPASIVAQYLFPPLFDIYRSIIKYDDESTIFSNIDQIRISGLISGVGAGATSILASVFIFFLVTQSSFISGTPKRWNWLTFSIGILFLGAMALVGTTGFILVGIFFFSLFISGLSFSIFSIIKKILISIVFLSCGYFFVIKSKFIGISYISVFINYGWDGLSDYRSMRYLMRYYDDFWLNMNVALKDGGLWGNANAIQRTDLSDIGIINQINIYGISGLILLNAFLLYCIIIGAHGLSKKQNSLFYKYVHAGIFSSSLYLIIYQFKEFVAFQGAGPMALIIILLLYVRVLNKKSSLFVYV